MTLFQTQALLPQFPTRYKLEYTEQTLRTQPAKDDFTYPGAVLYPEYFEIRLHRNQSPLPAEKQYLDSVILALFTDYLALIRESVIENPRPLAIAYPHPTENTEDPRNTFKPANQRNLVFPVRTREVDAQAKLSEVFFGRAHPGRQAFHLLYDLKLLRSSESFELRVGFFWENRLLLEQRETFNESETLEKVMQISSAIRRRLAAANTGSLSVSGTPERISVYLDNVFFGKTPLLLDSLAPGNYTLTLRKEGFQDVSAPVTINTGTTTEYRAQMQPPEGIGSIEIVTNPPGARIYNGALFSGTTPAKLKGLPMGTIRLHLTLNGYIDEFRNFNVSKENPHHLWRLQLKPGKPEDFYRPEAPVLGHFTWYDFFLASLGLAGGFTAGSIYFAVQRDNTRDKMLAQLSTNNPALFTEADRKLYRESMSRMDRYANYSSLSLASAGVSLVFAFYSFYRHILTTDAQFARKTPVTETRFGVQTIVRADSWSLATSYHF